MSGEPRGLSRADQEKLGAAMAEVFANAREGQGVQPPVHRARHVQIGCSALAEERGDKTICVPRAD